MTEGGSLEDPFCAFIDILGFSNYVAALTASVSDATKTEIIGRLHNVNAQFEEERRKFDADIRDGGALTYFSDFIFLSIRSDINNSFRRLCHYADRIRYCIAD